MVWEPEIALLGTVREFEQFNYSIKYYEETPAAIVPGQPAGVPTKTYYPVTITPATPQQTITVTSGLTATISGHYRYIFYDTIIYRDFHNNIKTLQGTATQGTWEQLVMSDCYQMVEFIPDSSRTRTFDYFATANNAVTAFTIDVTDYNWTPGMISLQNAVSIIRSRGD